MLLIQPNTYALRLANSRGYYKSRLCIPNCSDDEVRIAARNIRPSNKHLSILNRVASSLASLSWFNTKIQTNQGTKTVEVNLSSAVKRLKISYFQAIKLCVTDQLSEEIHRVEKVRKKNSLSTLILNPEKAEAVMEKLESYGNKPIENGVFVTDKKILKHFHEDKKLFYLNKTFYIVDTKELGHGASKTVYKANRIYDKYRENLVLSHITGKIDDFEMNLIETLPGSCFPKNYAVIKLENGETMLIQKECELGDLYHYYFYRKIDMKTRRCCVNSYG